MYEKNKVFVDSTLSNARINFGDCGLRRNMEKFFVMKKSLYYRYNLSLFNVMYLHTSVFNIFYPIFHITHDLL